MRFSAGDEVVWSLPKRYRREPGEAVRAIVLEVRKRVRIRLKRAIRAYGEEVDTQESWVSPRSLARITEGIVCATEGVPSAPPPATSAASPKVSSASTTCNLRFSGDCL